MCPPPSPTPPQRQSTNASFLGNLIEICFVTRDHNRTIQSLLPISPTPWKTYTFTPDNTTAQTYHNQPSPFTLKVCFAEPPSGSSNPVWEIIQPLEGSGPSIFEEFLETHGEGIHHVAYDCNGVPWGERMQGFEERGFVCVQGGSWMGKDGEGRCRFAFFEREGEVGKGAVFETILFEEGWFAPEADEIIGLGGRKD
jgi:methylmalonyl-CoA/ethylmalonyl-CoA epimerase